MTINIYNISIIIAIINCTNYYMLQILRSTHNYNNLLLIIINGLLIIVNYHWL